MLADELVALAREPRQVAPFTDRYPDLTPARGYEAARTLHRQRLAAGWKPAGRKIGFTNRTLWPRHGVHGPIRGMVCDRTLLPCEGDRATVPLAGLVQPRIEPEICFGLKARPRPGRALDAIAWIAHSIEIVHCLHPGWKLKLADSTAANGLHGRLVVGRRVLISDVPGLADALPRVRMTLKKGSR